MIEKTKKYMKEKSEEMLKCPRSEVEKFLDESSSESDENINELPPQQQNNMIPPINLQEELN